MKIMINAAHIIEPHYGTQDALIRRLLCAIDHNMMMFEINPYLTPKHSHVRTLKLTSTGSSTDGVMPHASIFTNFGK